MTRSSSARVIGRNEGHLTPPANDLKISPMKNRWQSKISRRRSLRVLGTGSLAVGLLAVTGCGGEEEPSGPSCSTQPDAQSQQMRSTLQYVEQSTVAGKTCANCAQYKPGEFGECGGCNLFGGPVRPGGYCISWAEQAEGGAAAMEG